MSAPLLIQGLRKSYGSFQALKGLDLEVKPGQCLGLLGPNGAGKSTTLQILTGQLKPTDGEVRVFGIDPTKEPKKVHALIGYVPDKQTLYYDLSVYDNLIPFARLHQKQQQDVEEILREVQLLEKKQEKISNLSKGLKQRVLLARALVHRPPFIILDEPTTGLDPSSAESLYLLLEKLKQQGATLLMTTHLMGDVERLCDQVTFINQGQKIEEGSPSELKRKYSLPRIEVIVRARSGIETHSFEKGPRWEEKLLSITKDKELERIWTHEPQLEDIFVKLIGEQK